MTKIDIVSGFLGAGKTTLIKKLLKEALGNSKVVLIENEFGEIGIDGGFLKDAGIEIKEMNSGCICCSLVGDFASSLKEVMDTYHPERILIEPSGVGKLSDVTKAVLDAGLGAKDGEGIVLNSSVAVVDATKCKIYIKNFGEFFVNQIEHAQTIILSRTDVAGEEKIRKAVEMIREHNRHAVIITTPLDQLDGADILRTIEHGADLERELMEEVELEHHHGHGEACGCGKDHHHENGDECGCGHDHHHEHGEECGCGHDHHHEHGDECGCGHDHHHEHGDECGCGHDHHQEHGEECGCGHDHHHEHEECGCGHDHHHEHGEECGCGHDHDGHHHADEVFSSWGMETPSCYTPDEIGEILDQLDDEGRFGFVLRAKGMVPAGDGTWVYFDYVPGESSIRGGKPDIAGRFCVIGSRLNEEALKRLFAR